MKKTIGILAHVDAGKTTLSDMLLYITGKVRNLGQVNNKTSNLDTNETEKARGITIFADQAQFEYNDNLYYLIDTPGHIDFSPETERSLLALDYAILIINGPAGVQSHTFTLFRLLESYNIPVFIFINKTDMEGFDAEKVLNDIKIKLTKNIAVIDSIEEWGEIAAENDEDFIEKYIEGKYSIKDIEKSLSHLIKERKIFPISMGTALNSESIKKFFGVFDRLTYTDYSENEDFEGVVYKIRNIDTRLTFIKCLKGKINVKDELVFDESEKINEIRFYNGEKFENAQSAAAGDVFAVTGFKTPVCGSLIRNKNNNIEIKEYIMQSALESGIIIKDGTDVNTVMKKMKIIESEEPSLSVHFNNETQEVLIYAMGKIQLEVLEQEVKERFNIKIGFKNPKIRYRESIALPVTGYGHFEPMRHYAEVKLRLEPGERGRGITFESKCDKEKLPAHWHKLIEKHIFEKTHIGILTGSPLTDVHIVLVDGKDHLKHTEPGDFREATYRAVRQGLEKAENILLEPYYRFDIYADSEYIGRIMSDIQKRRGSFEPPQQSENYVYIRGRGPVEEFMNYGTEFLAFTKGTGTVNMIFDGYEVCEEDVKNRVIEERAYNKGADKENPSSSVFAAKGTSFVAEWYECEQYMRTYSEE